MYVIEPKKVTWWRLVVSFHGTTLPKLWPRLLLVTAIASVVTIVHELFWRFSTALSVVPFTLVGLPLGISLGFRNSSSYERFAEGRKLWGGLVNTSRSYTRMVLTLLGPLDTQTALPRELDDDDERSELTATRARLVHRQIAYVHALRMHLRGEEPFQHLAEVLSADEVSSLKGERNVPNAILQRAGEDLRSLWQHRWIHTMHLPLFEGALSAVTDIQGGCERIKSTPLPFSYIVLLHRVVALYCIALPFGLVDALKWSTPLAVLFVSFALFGLDAIGDELEDPFGKDPNDLPLNALCRTIEINLRQRLGEKDLPAPLKPVDHLLD